MVELDGIETLHIMKKRSGHLCTDSKVIAVTANAYPGARDVYLKEGFDDFSKSRSKESSWKRLFINIFPKISSGSPMKILKISGKKPGFLIKQKQLPKMFPQQVTQSLPGSFPAWGLM